MKITTSTGLVGFLLALSTLSSSPVQATGSVSDFSSQSSNLEQRLNRLTETLQNRQQQLDLNPQSAETENSKDIAQFRNVFRNGGNFRNSGGWLNGGSFRNGGGWRNGWRDGGGFVNFRNW